MPDRTSVLAIAYLLALVACFATALASVLVPGPIESAVGADGLDAVRLGSSVGLIGLLAVADRVNERLGVDPDASAGTDDDRERDDPRTFP